MTDIALNPKVIEIIDGYMDSRKQISAGLERICINELREKANDFLMRKSVGTAVRLKGEPPTQNIYYEKFKTYFDESSWYRYSWQWSKRGWGFRYWLFAECERYFDENSERFILNFLHDTYKDIETAVLQTDSFMELAREFQNWFDERRRKFMEQTDTDIQKWKEACVSAKPQSHGGVANLLKVLTKTMEKQGTDIQSVAKVQYAVCVQAGIYIPDEFVRDVAVTLEMKEIEQLKESD